MSRTSWRYGLVVGGGAGLVLLAACAARVPVAAHNDEPPDPVALRCQLAFDVAADGLTKMVAPDGQTVFVSPQVELDDSDVHEALVLHKGQSAMLELVLHPLGAHRLEELTRTHVGARVAVFIDETLICAIPIYGSDASGRIHVIGRLTPQKAEEIAAGLNQRRVP